MHDKELKQKVLQHLELSEKDVFSIYDDKKQKLWVKTAKESGSGLLQRIAYKIMKSPVLIPSQNQEPQESIRYEADRLKNIATNFAYVPEVIISEDNFMLIKDSGTDLRKFLNSQKDKDKIEEIIYNALDVLIEFHNLGYYHGGSQIKNFTMKDEEIYLIDFEEKFLDADIQDLQFRDMFLFLISIAKLKYDFDFKKIIDTYIAKTSNKNFHDKFSEVLKSARFIMWLLSKKSVYKRVGRDTKSLYKLFNQIA